MYTCQEGEAHHLSTGKAVDQDHNCEDSTLPIAINNYLAQFPGVWGLLPWTCLTCEKGNDGLREHCGNTSCTGTRAQALETVLEAIGQELSLMYEVEVENPELVSVRYMLELLFSPHNHRHRGLLKEAFLIPVKSEDPCACMTTLGLCDSSALSTTLPSTALPPKHNISNTMPT